MRAYFTLRAQRPPDTAQKIGDESVTDRAALAIQGAPWLGSLYAEQAHTLGRADQGASFQCLEQPWR